MALEIILGVLVVLGTLAGTGLGYALSMRGKREEWAKEYREKRFRPLIDFVNEYMELQYQGWLNKMSISEARKVVEEIEAKEKDTDNTIVGKVERLDEYSQSLERLGEKFEKASRTNEKLVGLMTSQSWQGFFLPSSLDKKLDRLTYKFIQGITEYSARDATKSRGDQDKEIMKLQSIALLIVVRADELIVYGWKTPRIERWKTSITKACKKKRGTKA